MRFVIRNQNRAQYVNSIERNEDVTYCDSRIDAMKFKDLRSAQLFIEAHKIPTARIHKEVN